MYVCLSFDKLFTVIENTLMFKVFRIMYVLLCVCIYTGCPRRNVPEFGRVFLMLKYTDITQNTYVQS